MRGKALKATNKHDEQRDSWTRTVDQWLSKERGAGVGFPIAKGRESWAFSVLINQAPGCLNLIWQLHCDKVTSLAS